MQLNQKSFFRLFTVLTLLALVGGIAFGAVPLTAFAQNSSSGTVKILVDASQPALLQELSAQAAELLQDYGSFSLWRIPAASLPDYAGRPGLAAPLDIDRIWLRGAAIDTPAGEPTVPAGLRQALSDSPQLWLVQFVGPIRDEWLETLAEIGLEAVIYMPNNAYVVWGDVASLARLSALVEGDPAFQWSGAYHPAYRLSPQLEAAATSGAGEMVDVSVQFYRTDQTTQSIAALLAISGRAYQSPSQVLGFTNISLQVPANRLIELANAPDVFNIEPWVAPQPRDEVQNQIIAGQITTSGGMVVPSGPGYLDWLASKGFPTTPASYPIVDVVDDGLDQGNAASVLHPDFYEFGSTSNPDRVIYISDCTTDPSGNAVGGHGNLNAGIIGSYNNLSGAPYEDAGGYLIGLGVSPYGRIAATKIFRNTGGYDVSQCGGTETGVVAASYLAGAAFTSNSWGANTGGSYTVSSQAYDRLTRDAYSPTAGNQQMLHIFAAGNAGPGTNTVGSPGSGKNVLTVGATENVRDEGIDDGCFEPNANNADDIAEFSSRGPTDDQRVKPEIMAPGTHVQGPASQDPAYDGSGVCGALDDEQRYYPTGGQTLYTWSSGTSHSTPAVAGAASLAYEYYGRVINPGMTPSPAMLKALLLNSPRYLDGSGTGGTLPSNNQGWGDVNLGFLFDGTDRIVYDQRPQDMFTTTGQERLFTGVVSASDKPFRATLVWTDAPGSTTGNAYVNNLNLEVTVGGNTYLGNVFSGANSVTGGTADPRNNVENVFIPAGVSGAFTVKVVAANIAGDGVPGDGDITDQDFALLVYNGSATETAVLAVDSRTMSQVSGNSNGVVDPGETFSLDIPLRNDGTVTATSVLGTLSLTSGSASLGNAVSTYPNIAPAQVQANSLPYLFTVGLDHACGAPLAFTLTVTYDPSNTLVYNFTVPVGTPSLGAPATYNSSDVPKVIPDNTAGGVNSTLTVGDSALVGDVNVRIGSLVHTYDGDLVLRITSPEGSTVILANRRGGSGDNYTNTLFDDSAAVPISSGSAPFTGSYIPEEPLAVINDQSMAGVWTLNVADLASADLGTLQAWSLDLTPVVYTCSPYVPNSPPVALDDSYTVSEDTSLNVNAPGVLANDSDPDSDPLTATLSSPPVSGSLSLNLDGSFTYTPAANQNGSVSFTYQVSDGELADSAIVTINITQVNDPPVLNDQTVALNESGQDSRTLSASDPDSGDSHTYTILTPPAYGDALLNPTSGLLTYTPANRTASYSDPLTVQVSDSGGLSDTAVITYNVTAANDQPTAVDDSYSLDQDTQVELAVLANDSDPDSDAMLLISAVGAPDQGGSLINSGTVLTYTPAAGFLGVETFTYTVSDGFGGFDTALVSLDVHLPNPAPEVDAGEDQAGIEGQELAFSGSFVDPGLLAVQAGETIEWDFGDGAVITGTLTPSHAYGDDGAYTVTLTVTDALGAAGTDTLLVTVSNADPILALIPDQSIRYGSPFMLSGSFSDPGWLDTHTVAITWAPGITQTLTLAAGQAEFDASHTYPNVGAYQVTVTVVDDDGGQHSRSFMVTVTSYPVFTPLLWKDTLP